MWILKRNMELNKIILLIGILFFIFLLPNISAVIINEIMYDASGSDSGREWIEIYNDGSEINLTGWKFYEGGTNHGLSLIRGDFILGNNEYAIISSDDVSFLLEYAGFSGTLFDSSFSLLNSGEELTIKNSSLDIINSLTYSNSWGANGDGNSLQLCDGSFKGKSQTSGSINDCSTNQTQINNQTQNNANTTTNTTYSQTLGINYPEKVFLNQEFSFKIKLINFNEDIYDVKIDILSNENRISEILNENVWKSTSYYVNNIISPNAEKEFLMKITKEFESAEITIKIKDSSDKTKIFSGYSISKSNEAINETLEESAYQNSTENIESENGTIIISGSATVDAEDIKSKENTTKLNKNDYAKYILIAFAFLLALLFLKKIFKKEYKNEFQEK